MPLDYLALKHGTDKASTAHGFAEIYERELPAPDTVSTERPLRILEIGVESGASLRMWRDWYTAENGARRAAVIGVDSNPACLGCKEEGIDVILADASDAAFAEALGSASGPFDVVVDDGSHKCQDQVASFRALWPYVRAGGVYVVEDLHASYFPEYQVDLEAGVKEGVMDYLLKGLLDAVNGHGKDWAALGVNPEHVPGSYEATIESVRFYRHVCFVWKRVDA